MTMTVSHQRRDVIAGVIGVRTWKVLQAAMVLAVVTAAVAAPPGIAEAQRTGLVRVRPGWGVNGQVYAVAVLGDTLFVGGEFTAAVSRTGATLPRDNLAAFSLRTGRPLRGWVANTSGAVRALTAARGAVWVGGKFDSVNGRQRLHLAKVAAANGQVSSAFRLDTNGTVRTIAVTKTRLYAGGDFTAADEASAPHLLAAGPATGQIATAFHGSADGTVWSLAARPREGALYVGGLFASLSGSPRSSLGAVDLVSGAARHTVFRRSSGPVLGLDVSGDGARVVAAVGGAPRAAAGNSIAAWNARTGHRAWRVRVRGDGQAVSVLRGTVYAGFHGGYATNRALRLLAIDLRTGTVHARFEPRFNHYWGVRAVAATRNGIAVGGDFTRVARTPSDGVAVFAAPRWRADRQTRRR